jgi:hypothetical protein
MRYEEYLNIQLGKLQETGLIDSELIPDMDLYIDQIDAFFKKQTDNVDSETARRFLTKTMINNYAKNNMIPRPVGKKYTKDHIMMILMVAYLKGIFKMEDIGYLMKPLVENYNSDFDESIDSELIYRTACDMNVDTAEKIKAEVDESTDAIKKIFQEHSLEDDERMEIFTLILAMTMRADMEKYIASRLLERYFKEPAKEKPEKEKKQKK